jgi:hypothetical protein
MRNAVWHQLSSRRARAAGIALVIGLASVVTDDSSGQSYVDIECDFEPGFHQGTFDYGASNYHSVIIFRLFRVLRGSVT